MSTWLARTTRCSNGRSKRLIASGSFYIVGLIFAVLIPIGFVFLIIPGLMLAFGLTLAVAFQTGLYGRAVVGR
ncbi:MAG: hypothetical protein HND48_05265 [Chloroflexi bacterium]|nr:hypothetical protein [Chloroflexota bacterium]